MLLLPLAKNLFTEGDIIMSASKKALEAILWAGADILRSKMDANEYKDYLLSFVFYKYLSDTFLVKVYDLLEDAVPSTIEKAQLAYEEAFHGEDAADLLTDEPLKKPKARSQMIAELQDIIVKEIMPLQIGK